MYKDIEKKVIDFMNEYDMVSDGDTIVVATSGGADSVALLNLFVESKDKIADNLTIVAATVNHGIRAESADRDMHHVEEVAEKLGVKCIVFNAKTDGTVVPAGASEEWARKLRYDYFKRLPEILGVPESRLKIATAHTESDQAETVLFRLSRSASYKSLMGIPVKRNNFIRPFLCLTRADTEFLCEHFNTEFVTDETNLEDDYCRNKIRHNVIPVLSEINDEAEQHIADLAEYSRKLNEYFLHKAKVLSDVAAVAGVGWDVSKLKDVDDLELEAFTNYIIEYNDVQPSKVNMRILADMIKNGKGGIQLSNTVSMAIHNGILELHKEQPEIEKVKLDKFRDKLESGSYEVEMNSESNYKVKVSKISKAELCDLVNNYGIRELAHVAVGNKLFSGIIMDNFDPDDKFKPAKRMSKKVRKFYSEMPIIAKDNQRVPCLKQADTGEIVWMYGLGFTDGFSPDMSKIDEYPDDLYMVL